jgi:hypothetical protein
VKELVTVLTLMGIGLWVVQDGTQRMFRMALLSCSEENRPDPKFVGFNVDGPNTRHEMKRYREIYLNPQWEQSELAKSHLARPSSSWQ